MVAWDCRQRDMASKTMRFACASAMAVMACIASCTTPAAEPVSAASAAWAAGDAKVGDGAVAKGPRKLDVLWVIDHSSSMCQEQRALAKGLAGFVSKLTAAPAAIDLQMAVVTVQQLADTKNIVKVGQFVHAPATTLPPSCIERTRFPCSADAHCTEPVKPSEQCALSKPLPPGDWYCKPAEPTFQVDVAGNCLPNSTCQLRCKSDADCFSVFEPGATISKHQVRCNTVVSPAGCMFDPPTAGCPTPEHLLAVLKSAEPAQITQANGTVGAGSTLDWLRCNAFVGANQEPEALFEGGLRSAWLALDPKGPNCPQSTDGKPLATCQYQQLVRPDALLAIVVVSDDDDCSLSFELADKLGGLSVSVDGNATLKAVVGQQDQQTCYAFNDRLGNNKHLIAGWCAVDQAKAASEKRKAVACPQDCPALGKPGDFAYDGCVKEAADHVAALKAIGPAGRFQDDRFAAAADFLDRFQSLKADKQQVLFATITGDLSPPYGTTNDGYPNPQLAAYLASGVNSKLGVLPPYQCQGALGWSGYGGRYLRLAQLFGANGYSANLCAPGDIGAALDGLAAKLLAQ